MPMEELVGKLSTVDNWSDDEEEGASGIVYITEQQWLAHMKRKEGNGFSTNNAFMVSIPRDTNILTRAIQPTINLVSRGTM
uniref:Uncharacterized protein n=1 Tax=Oryza brachyantha TaxID=4533 RepID=J3N7F8_ORYBR